MKIKRVFLKRMLDIRNLTVKLGKRKVLDGLNLKIKPGEIHILFGANGSGKTSLLKSILNLPQYQIVSGYCKFGEYDLSGMSTSEISQLGVGMAFQNPPQLAGVKIKDFLRAIKAKNTGRALRKFELRTFKNREINRGFSGGEIKRWEIMKLAMQDSKLMLFDEPESGVDMEHIGLIGKAINNIVKGKRSALIITHTGFILNHVKADKGHVMKNGKIIRSGNPLMLFKDIQSKGY
jgi:Fe-S cluster assembly ATP-binding protein